jgi:hypothetical protein
VLAWYVALPGLLLALVLRSVALPFWWVVGAGVAVLAALPLALAATLAGR